MGTTRRAPQTTPAQLSYRQLREQSDDQLKDQQLQYDVRSNLNGLSESLNKTSRELDEAKKNLQTEYRREKINWTTVGACKDAINSLEAGLVSLKEDRQMLFPDWKEVATAD